MKWHYFLHLGACAFLPRPTQWILLPVLLAGQDLAQQSIFLVWLGQILQSGTLETTMDD